MPSGAIDLLPTLAELAGSTTIPVIQSTAAAFYRRRECGGQLEERNLLSIKNNQVSIRTQRFRLDYNGALFDIENDRGQRSDVSGNHPELVSQLRALAEAHKAEMTRAFEKNRGRPFTLGFAASTTLPARDGNENGEIKRSVRSPNNSFFTNWTRTEDSITWSAEVVEPGNYEVTVFYTCQAGNEGAQIRLTSGRASTTVATVTKAFDPPFYDKSIERMAESHYWMKEFIPLSLGILSLKSGEQILKLEAQKIPGKAAIDVHSIRMVRRNS